MGEVVDGNLGSFQLMEYTVIGAAVQDLGSFNVKGWDVPLGVYGLVEC